MLLEALSIGSSLLGGVLQSNAANKASKAQVQSQREAIAAQQRASGQVQDLQAPGVAAYGAGMNALTGRLGLPTQGVASAVAGQGGTDYASYLAANPDVAAAYQAEATRDGKSQDNLRAQGIQNAEDYARWHYDNYGRAEGREAPTAPTPSVASMGESASPAGQNSLTGSYGNTADPTWTPPPAFSFDINSFVDNPAYKFAMEQGSGQVLASNSATGSLQSGAALKRLQDRGQQTAYNFFDQERDQAYGEYLDNYKLTRAGYESDRGYLTDRHDQGTDDLFRYTGVGQNALNTTSNSIMGQGEAEADGLARIGDVRAGNALQQGNIWSSIAGQVGGAAAGVINGLGTKKPSLTTWSQNWGGGS